MAYRLNFHYEDTLLVIEISGKREISELTSHAKAAWRKIATVSQAKQCKNLLVISNASGKYPALEALLINSSLDQCGVQRAWKIAFVNLDRDSFQDVKFAETVAVNRGFNLGVFRSEDVARHWLLEPS